MLRCTLWFTAVQCVEDFSLIRLKADGKFINVDSGHAAPFVYDFNKDGKRDLLVGQFKQGRLRIYLNIGTDIKPQYDKEQWFKSGGDFGKIPSG